MLLFFGRREGFVLLIKLTNIIQELFPHRDIGFHGDRSMTCYTLQVRPIRLLRLKKLHLRLGGGKPHSQQKSYKNRNTLHFPLLFEPFFLFLTTILVIYIIHYLI